MNVRRNALSLSAVLAATVLTGGAAILGITHGTQASPPAAQPAVFQAAQSQAPQGEGD
jgi:hypothetical protein